ncbi:MAG: amidohydrolase [Rhodospirillaceae bacterium]|nr:amidohydrolase [Rhodospirillaceae bacterium]
MPVINSIAALHDEMAEWRHDIHAHPEIAFEEVRTAGIVADKLRSWGIEVHTGIAKTGVVGVLKGRSDNGRAIGLRADMDALPMTEQTGLPYQSTNPGRFHGCGHDGHTTMLLGAARYLAETRNFEGTVHFIFQPGEEGGGGGKIMVEEGLFDRFACDEVYALHNWPQLPVGTIGIKSGPAMAATDTFTAVIRGHGGHAAMPHMTVDPVVIGAQIVTAWQSLVSRTTDPVKSAVVSVTQFHAGSAFNVIPGQVDLCGTVRTFESAVRDRVRDGMIRIAEGIATGFGGRAEVDYIEGYPATVNPPEYADVAAAVAQSVVGVGKVERDLEPVMGGEDFSYMLNERPGAYVFVGQAGGPNACSVHNPHYDFNDEILPIGASLLASFAEHRLR